MANEAGIDLILRAPNLKPIMSDVIDDMKEISKQDRIAEDATIDLEIAQAKLRDSMKQSAITNQNIKKAIEDVTAASKEQTGEVVSGGEKQRSGILNTIKVYFQQRIALKEVGKEMVILRQEIFTLDQRQQQLIKTARTSDKAYKEFTANKERIEDLSIKLQDLNGEHRFLNASVKETEKRYAAFGKVFSVIKNGAFLAVAAVAAVALAGVAAIAKIVSQSDFVEDKFKIVSKKVKDISNDLINAFAPIGLGLADGLVSLLSTVGNALESSQSKIFDWAANVGAYIFALAKSLPFIFDHISKLFTKLATDIEFSGQLIQSAVKIGINPLSTIDELKKIDEVKDRVVQANKDLADSSDKTALIFKESFDLFLIEMEKQKKAILSHTNLTKEDEAALKKLRDEYDKLTESIRKQIETLDIKEAGAFAGVILKAELAAKELEISGARAVLLAIKLHENADTVAKLREDVARLAQAVRDDAVKFLTDQADAIIDSVNKKLEDIRARQAGTEGSLRISREIQAQFKEFQNAQSALQAIIDKTTREIENAKEESRNANEEILKDGLKAATDLAAARAKFAELSGLQNLEFNKARDTEILDAIKKNFEKQLDGIKEKGEQLQKALAGLKGKDGVSLADFQDITIKINVNKIDLAVATEQLRQVNESLDTFKKTGVPGVVEAEIVIRQRIEGAQTPVSSTSDPANPIDPVKTSLFDKLDEFVQRYGAAFSTITDIVTSSVDAQIEAIGRLVDAREKSVEKLEHDVQFEGELKALGLATDYVILKKKLDDERALRDEALKKQNALNEKQAKLQRLQDSVSQASSLATAIANMFKGITATLNPGAFLLAIIASGVLIAAFAAAKLKASAIARAYTGSRRVGKTFGTMAENEGYDDRPGRDRGLSVVDSKGRLRGYMGGDEYLHKESVSRKHNRALAYLDEHEAAFSRVDLMAWLKIAERDGASSTIRLDRTIERNDRLREKIIIVNTGGITKKEMQEAVAMALKEQTDRMIAYHESRPDYVPASTMDDHYKINSGSKKRIRNK